MTKSFNEQECAHLPCGCPLDAGGDYCSPQCEKSARKGETDCNCFRPDCRAEA